MIADITESCLFLPLGENSLQRIALSSPATFDSLLKRSKSACTTPFLMAILANRLAGQKGGVMYRMDFIIARTKNMSALHDIKRKIGVISTFKTLF